MTLLLDRPTNRLSPRSPMGFAAGDANLYRYAFNNPTILKDPSGLTVTINGQEIDRDKVLRTLQQLIGSQKLGKSTADLLMEIAKAQLDAKYSFDYKSVDQFMSDALLRVRVVYYSKELDSNGCPFNREKKIEFPGSKYWEEGMVDTVNEGKIAGIGLKKGTKPSDAIKEFFGPNGKKAKMDCATAQMIVFRRALLDILGEEAFNRMFAGVPLAGFYFDQKLANTATDNGKREAIPGDSVMFLNPDGKDSAFRNENTIYLGGGLYWGHGIGIKNKADMIKALNALRKAGSTRSCEPSEKPGYIDRTQLPDK